MGGRRKGPCWGKTTRPCYQVRIQNWRGRDGNDPSVGIAKDVDQRF